MSENKTILLVDDDPEVIDYFSQGLSEEYKIVTANDGAAASMKVLNQSFDLLICDYKMPRMNGIDLIKEIRTDKFHGSIPVILISGFLERSQAEEVENICFLDKPVDLAELKKTIKKMLTVPAQGQKKQAYAVDVDVINAVISSTQHVLASFGLTGIQPLGLKKKDSSSELKGDISSIVEMIGQGFNGKIVVSFEEKAYLALMYEILGEEQAEINADNKDGIAEVNNMILGNAKKALEKFKFAKVIPTIMVGHQHSLSFPAGTVGMTIPFQSSAGEFFIEILALPI